MKQPRRNAWRPMYDYEVAALRSQNILGILLHNFQNMIPIISSLMMIMVNVMKSMEHNCGSLKIIQVFNMVVNHVIGADDAFIATKNNVTPTDEGEVLAQPFEFLG